MALTVLTVLTVQLGHKAQQELAVQPGHRELQELTALMVLKAHRAHRALREPQEWVQKEIREIKAAQELSALRAQQALLEGLQVRTTVSTPPPLISRTACQNMLACRWPVTQAPGFILCALKLAGIAAH
jgi:predicted metal-dependent hydrolase